MWARGDVSEDGFERLRGSLPILERSRFNWLADAEVSFRSDRPDLGLSWFFTDPFERDAFFEAYGIPDSIVRVEHRMRERFEFAPRTWIKADVAQSDIRSYSQYFVIDSRLENPISTLRLGLRALGAQDVSRIEPVFDSVLGRAGCLWAIVAKWGAEGPSPRLSCYVPRETLPTLIRNLVAAGSMSESVAPQYIATNEAIVAGPSAYLSLDLGQIDAVTLDFVAVDSGSVPEACRPFWGERPDSRRYLKYRWSERHESPAWSVYRSLPDILTFQRSAPDAGRAFAAASDYYQAHCDAIIEAYGASYQAGGLGEDSMSRHVVETTEIEPGMTIVDAGCGACGPATEIASLVPSLRIVGLTASSRQAAAGERHLAPMGKLGEVLPCVADYHRMPVPSRSADRVLFLESLGYADLDVVLAEAARVLKPGGRIYLKEPLVTEDPVGSAEAYELAEFDRVYAQRTPSVEAVRKALKRAGLTVTLGRPFGKEMTAERFTRAMFGPDGLNPFGKTHYRAFKRLPIAFYEIVAEKSS